MARDNLNARQTSNEEQDKQQTPGKTIQQQESPEKQTNQTTIWEQIGFAEWDQENNTGNANSTTAPE